MKWREWLVLIAFVLWTALCFWLFGYGDGLKHMKNPDARIWEIILYKEDL
jgi:hypothetical protein